MRKILAPLFILIFCLPLFGASVPDDFDKFELVSTPERTVVGIDAKGLVVYGKNGETITAYDILSGSALFELGENQDKVAPFNADGTAVITGKEGYTASIVAKDGTLLAVIPEGYSYSKEYSCGFVCLIDKTVTENVYTIIDRSGNIIAEHFYAPACELENGNIVIANAGGGHSIITTDGKVTPFDCLQIARIEDAVSICTGVYVGTDGNVYSADNKLLYENTGFSSISPVNGSYALGIKESENGAQQYIINIKDKKETIIEANGLFGDYIYSEGHVYDDKAFVGNSEKSVLVNLKNGKVLSEEVAGYSCFYEKLATVKTPEGAFRFMKSDGNFLEGEYVYATDFKNGYALAVEKTKAETVVSLVNTKGKKYQLHSLPVYQSIEAIEGKAELLVAQEGVFNNITIRKTENGNIFIGNSAGSSYVYAMKENGNTTFKVIVAAIALVTLVFIAINAGFTIKRKKVVGNEKM